MWPRASSRNGHVNCEKRLKGGFRVKRGCFEVRSVFVCMCSRERLGGTFSGFAAPCVHANDCCDRCRGWSRVGWKHSEERNIPEHRGPFPVVS